MKMFPHIRFSSRAEDEEDIGEDSDAGGENENCRSAASPEKQPPSSPPHSDSYSVLFDLSSVEEQLQIKKGLSKYYVGKSQSFTTLSEVKSLEDLPKKEKVVNLKRKLKPFNSYRGGWDESYNSTSLCDACNIPLSKKISSSVASCASAFARSGSGSLLGPRRRPPPIPVNKDQ